MNKDNYDIEYFLQNEAFVKWVKGPDSESNLFWKEWLHSHPSNKEAFLQAKELVLVMSFETSEPSDSEFNEVLQKVLKGNESKTALSPDQIPTDQWRWITRVAASLTLLILATFVFLYTTPDQKSDVTAENIASKTNPYGRKSKLAFSDGSTATLNAGSSLSYLSKFSSDLREVELQGEAFFEVNKDPQRPFVVWVGGISATVLGTSFNIESHEDEATTIIALKTGKLKVEVPGSNTNFETYILVPGQKLVHDKDKNKVDVLAMATEDMGLWTKGVLVFDQDDFPSITKKLERWFDVDVELIGSGKEGIQFSTKYKNETLSNMLMSMSFALNFDYEIEDKRVQIKFKK
ncbi:FecR family protein [Reichenbachiella faecimaris]|uniref:FecR family protein n=1 Tax=Reichenbachiella faecimaris TaxID=692418 RepID=A0A1W2GL51_REIFA|nr:FecR family protein [Reichenbachiella faecimaris]SMD37284.1 FecR family protein [Reichenbachiella faecimaris]